MSKGRKIAMGISGGLALLFLGAGVISLLYCLYHVEQKCQRMTVELGEEISGDIHDYLEGYDFALNRAQLDTEGVDTARVGEYQAVVSLPGERFLYQVSVVDTTAPEIQTKVQARCFSTEETYGLEDFVKSAWDLSGEVSLYMMDEDGRTEQLSFPEAGIYRVTVYGEDVFGNVGEASVSVMVDEPPKLVGIHDRYIEVGEHLDLRKYIFALDNLDGVITERIKVWEGGFDPNIPGAYEIGYSVTDSNGLTDRAVLTVYVGMENDGEDILLSREDMQLLCDGGYFTYEPLRTKDYDAALDLVAPALVNLKNRKGSGSGFIYRITPENVYFLSVGHALEVVSQNSVVHFYNGTEIRQSYDYEELSEENEIAIFSLPTDEIPLDTLLELKEIHVEEGVYDSLSVGDTLIAYSIYWSGEKPVIRDLCLTDKQRYFTSHGHNCLETDWNFIPGMSGTAVVDCRGNLVGIAQGGLVDEKNQSNSRGYSLRIDEVESLYERYRKGR